jgi:hypothetical protein
LICFQKHVLMVHFLGPSLRCSNTCNAFIPGPEPVWAVRKWRSPTWDAKNGDFTYRYLVVLLVTPPWMTKRTEEEIEPLFGLCGSWLSFSLSCIAGHAACFFMDGWFIASLAHAEGACGQPNSEKKTRKKSFQPHFF